MNGPEQRETRALIEIYEPHARRSSCSMRFGVTRRALDAVACRWCRSAAVPLSHFVLMTFQKANFCFSL